MSEEEKKVQEIINESLNDMASDVNSISDIENIKFEDIKSRLEKEAMLIEEAKRINISVSLDDRDDAIKEINENQELTPEQKQEEIAKIEEIYETGMRLVGGNQIETLMNVLDKTKLLMDEMKTELDREIENLEFSDDFEFKFNSYNENVDAISEFGDKYGNKNLEYEKYNIDIAKLIEDATKFNELESTLNKTGITFENLDEKIDTMDGLLDRNPNCYRIINGAQSLVAVGSNVLDTKQRELLKAQGKLNITKEESKIYDSSTSDQEFVDLMLQNDKEAQSLNIEIENVTNEIKQLKEELNGLDENSEEYSKLENQLDEKISLSVDLKNNLADIKNGYLSRKIELNSFDEKYGKEIEEYNRLYSKLNDLGVKSKMMLHTYNQNRNKTKNEVNNEELINDNNKLNEENNIKIDENSDKENSNDEQNSNDNDNKNTNSNKSLKEEEKKSNVKNNKGNTERVSSSRDLKPISQPQNAKNTVDNFLKLTPSEKKSFLINGEGYSKLNDAIEILENNDEGYSIPRKDRKKILDDINSEMKFSLKEEKVNESKEDMLNLFSKLNGGNKEEGLDLYNELFTYDKSTKLPFISAALIEKKDQRKLANMINEYTMLLKDGGLSENEISNFERLIINPLIANSIKQNISNMGFLGKLRNKFSSTKLKPFHALNTTLKDFSEAKSEINSGKYINGPINLGDSVYSGNEVTMNEIERIINEEKERDVKIKSSGVR